MNFSHNSPLIRFLTMVADVMIIGVLWLVTSIALITIGASTTAAFYVMMRRISNRESSIVSEYFSAFKSNFVNATKVFITIAVAATIIITNILNAQISGTFDIILYALQILLAIELLFICVHIFPLASRFELKYMQLFKMALIIANKHIFISITHVAAFVAIVWVCLSAPVTLLFVFGFYCWASSYMLIKVYRKYIPELDKNFDNNVKKEE